jgi:hypothetical protein
MKLLEIRENKVTLELDWLDCAALGRACRELAASTFLEEAGLGDDGPFVAAFGAACEGASMAAWAHGNVREWCKDADYSLAGFRKSFGTGEEGTPAA